MIPRRLVKLVREATGRSVQDVERLWMQGAIEMDRPMPFGHDEIVLPGEPVRVHGAPLPRPTARLSYAMHKPVGVTTTARDPDHLADLSPWLGKLPAGVFPVGRLDRDTSGLLFLTSDGDLAYALLSPVHHVEKEYVCTPRRPIEPGDPRVDRLPVRARITGERTLVIVLTEGKHRQVRRMCKAVGLALSGLSRVRIGPIHLGSLPAGDVRPLEASEAEALWAAVGGRDMVRARQIVALEALARRRREAGTPDMRLEAWLACMLKAP